MVTEPPISILITTIWLMTKINLFDKKMFIKTFALNFYYKIISDLLRLII